MNKVISMYEKIGKGYTTGWWTNFKGRYRVFKGARNTKKSYVMIGLEVINKILSDSRRNILILRQIGANNRYSTFSTLDMLINLLGIEKYFKINGSNMTITYLPTKQQIIFAGMYPNPTRITSMRMPRGYLTDVYVEEAFEIIDYEGWRKIDGTIRGKLPEGLFHQITFCFNAWNKNHWLYEHFFKGRLEDNLNYLLTHDYQDWKDENLVIDYGKGLYLHTSTYKINEFRDKDIYDVAMEELRKVAPEIYKVEALGMWGNSNESTYPEYSDSLIMQRHEVFNTRYDCISIGIDTGLSSGDGKIKSGKDHKFKSATTMQMVGITKDLKTLICMEEYFHSNEGQLIQKTEPELQTEIIKKLREWKIHYQSHPDIANKTFIVYVDCADKGFREGLEIEARRQGFMDVRFVGSSKKVKVIDRVTFIRRIMAYGEYRISPSCQNLIRELKNSRQDWEKGLIREDFDDHCLNANEYAWIPIIQKLKRWGDYKTQ